jgi:hypothetical protein
MIKIAGGLPVRTRLPVTAWVLAALVTLIALTLSLTYKNTMHINTASDHVGPVAQQTIPPEKEFQQTSVLALLAWWAGVLALRS